VAFVNKQAGAEAQQDSAASGQPLDFDPNDPDVVKVHYDVSAWSSDQRAELSEALAEAEVPHAWDGDEVIVPEVIEAQADILFEELEKVLGPFPVVLDTDAESTEFGLDEWSDADRDVLTEALVASEVPHRWEGTTVVVAADAEHAVDDLLDAIEAGELLPAGDDDAPAPPEGALSTMFLSADRLAKDPLDAAARRTLIDLLPQVMLLAEIEVWHTRPAVPTRRVALGHLVLPVDPAPGFGGLLLGAVVAAHLRGVPTS
jgi:hypothetical protein